MKKIKCWVAITPNKHVYYPSISLIPLLVKEKAAQWSYCSWKRLRKKGWKVKEATLIVED